MADEQEDTKREDRIDMAVRVMIVLMALGVVAAGAYLATVLQ